MIKFNQNIPSNTTSPKSAFTLAEVLITLGIIGVVAALTIPSLVQKYQEKQAVTALKKVYSTLQSAYTMAVQENGTPENWDWGTGGGNLSGALEGLNKLAPYLKITKNCENSPGCWPDLEYKTLSSVKHWRNVNSRAIFVKGQLSDGTLLSIYSFGDSCSTLGTICAAYDVDINGFKPPNTEGKDGFEFYLTRTGIIPAGKEESTFHDYCYNYGFTCTAWILHNENMDYLHCNDLSWDGKHKCN